MKKLVIAGLVLFAAGCTQERVNPPSPPPVDWASFDRPPPHDAGKVSATDKERATKGAYVAAFSSPDFSALVPLLSDEAHFAFGGSKDARGKDRVAKGHDSLFGAFDDRKLVVGRTLVTDSSQTLEWTLTGIQARDWMGVAATHKPVTFKGVTLLWTRDDGSITDVHVYFDVALVKAQLGVGPKELQALPPPQPPSTSEETDQANTPDEMANVAHVRAMLEALAGNDASAYVSQATDDVDVFIPWRPKPLHGKEELHTSFAAMHKSIGQLATSVFNAWGIGKYVVVEYFVTGNQTGPIEYIPVQPSGVIRLAVLDIVEMRDGKVARVWRCENPSEIVSSF